MFGICSMSIAVVTVRGEGTQHTWCSCLAYVLATTIIVLRFFRTSLVAYVLMTCFVFDISDHADTHGREDHEGSAYGHRLNVDIGVLQRSLIKLLTLEWPMASR